VNVPRTIALAVGLLSLACPNASQGKEPSSKIYRVQHVQAAAISIDGNLGDTEWPADGWEADFSFPWRKRKTPRTEMCCVCDGERLLFAFQCDDSDLVLRGAVPEDEMTVAQGDRVELFFARDAALKEYYCLEMSPAGTVLDYRASFYRKFDDSWDCRGLVLAAGTHRGGYVVEGSIPLTTLEELCGTNASQGRLLVGAFRAEYSHTDSGVPEEAWISWIHPSVEKPDFHIPSALGTFHLQDQR
jgi:chondroitin AC lyase